ncbi:MAG: glycosyltransferase, partial [Planctomycetota bacterium]
DLERFEESMSTACRSLLQVHEPGLCLEVPKTHDSVRRTPWRGDRPLSLLHFGHRRREKGLLDLVQALRELPSGTVELVACGPEKEPGFDAELRAAAAEHFPLHLFGAYDGGQLAALASACDFAAFPSRIEEADALVVDEALALGLPVWASTGADPQGRIQSGARSTSETLESAPGRVLHAADPQTWRAAFEELLSSPEQHEEERAALTWSRGNQRTAQEAASELEGLLLELQAPLAGSKAVAGRPHALEVASEPLPLSHAS